MSAKNTPRATTLADARKMNLFPSVTGIIDQIAKPGLVKWQVEQGIKAALLLGRDNIESEDGFIARCHVEAGRLAKEARDLGGLIHDAVSKSLSGKFDSVPDDMFPYVIAATEALDKIAMPPKGGVCWDSEVSFASSDGYGGTIDLIHKDGHLLGDIKTTKTVLGKPIAIYDEHIMQLVAYRIGKNLPTDTGLFNLFISTTEPGRAELVLHDRTNISRAESMFAALWLLWGAKTGYCPQWKL
jgi:hypothetical protein